MSQDLDPTSQSTFPPELSKSRLISLLHDAGYTIKEMVAMGYGLVENHCRSSVRDFTLNTHKAEDARRIANEIGFQVPHKAGYDNSNPSSIDPLSNLIELYKEKVRANNNSGEIYKWQLVEKFKGRPDINAADFSSEIKSLNFSNLIYQMGRAALVHMGKDKPVELCENFKLLFNEGLPLGERIRTFNHDTLKLYKQIVNDEKLSHHQDERSISAYLTYHDPLKYTFYKSSFYKALCKLLSLKPATAGSRYTHYLGLVSDFITKYINGDQELLTLKESFLPNNAFRDENNLILAQDILYQTLENIDSLEQTEPTTVKYWLYAPGEKADMWENFYEEGVMALGWDELGDLKEYDNKDEITKKLQSLTNVDSSKKNDSTANYEFAEIVKIGDIVIVKRGRSELLGYGEVTSDYYFDEEKESYRSRRKVNWIKKGVWQTSHSLALKTFTDITNYEDTRRKHEFYYQYLMEIMNDDAMLHGGPLNIILYGPPGTGKTYTSIDMAVKIATGTSSDHGSNKKAFDKLRDAGQIQFVTFHQNYSYEDFMVGIRPNIDTEQLTFGPHKGIFYKLVSAAKDNYYASQNHGRPALSFDQAFAELISPLDEEQTVPIKMVSGISYNIYDVSNGTIRFRKENNSENHTLSVDTLKGIVEGTREFHSGLGSYYKPLVNLIKSRQQEGASTVSTLKNFVIVIDEINRANISRVFGELITLLEDDKRLGAENSLTITLPNGEKDFGIPPNVYVIGTMNTADKSIALIDIALRRRFEFIGYYPDAEALNGKYQDRIPLLEALNEAIYQKKHTADYLIGHGYFMKDESVEDIISRKIIPLLMEYFSGKVNEVISVFEKTDYSIIYNSKKFNWEVSAK